MAQVRREHHRPTVLLTGGTGQVGLFALPRLLTAGYSVVACSRKVARASRAGRGPAPGTAHWFHPGTVLAKGSGEDFAGENRLLQDVEVLLSCGPLSLAVLLAPHCVRLRRVVCVSSSSVYTKLESPNDAERRVIASIVDSENALKRFCDAGGISLVVLRPTMIYGCGLDRNVSRIARLAQRYHFMPVAGKASGRRQPLHADDLAAALLSLLEKDGPLAPEYPVAGGSTITYREMVERVFIAIGQTPRIAGIPPKFLATLMRAASWLPASRGLNAEMVLRQNRDLVFDDSRLRGEVGFNPRKFEPVPEDFRVPQEAMMWQP